MSHSGLAISGGDGQYRNKPRDPWYVELHFIHLSKRGEPSRLTIPAVTVRELSQPTRSCTKHLPHSSYRAK